MGTSLILSCLIFTAIPWGGIIMILQMKEQRLKCLVRSLRGFSGLYMDPWEVSKTLWAGHKVKTVFTESLRCYLPLHCVNIYSDSDGSSSIIFKSNVLWPECLRTVALISPPTSKKKKSVLWLSMPFQSSGSFPTFLIFHQWWVGFGNSHSPIGGCWSESLRRLVKAEQSFST